MNSDSVLATNTLRIIEFDDIKTTHWNVGCAAVAMLVKCLDPAIFSRSKLTVQDQVARGLMNKTQVPTLINKGRGSERRRDFTQKQYASMIRKLSH